MIGKARCAAAYDTAAPARAAADVSLRGGLALLLVSLLLPTLLLALASWQSRIDLSREANLRVERTLRVLHEHAVKVFETQRLMLERIDERLRIMDWGSEAERAGLHAYLKRLQDDYSQVATVTITDAQGRLVASSRRYPADPSVRFDDRDWFRALRDTDRIPIYVSRSYIGRQSDQAVFNLASRRHAPDGAFAGAIAISVDRAYFEAFYRDIDPDLPHSVTLIRSDGTFLARQPRAPMPALAAESDMFQAIAQSVGPTLRVSQVDGVARIVAYRPVADYPVYIGFGLDESVVSDAWWRNVASFAFIAGLSALALLGVSAYATRQARHERRAIRAWRATADALDAEAAERRSAEAQLRQAQKMEAVGRLTGGVAHDFNNLLTVVIGNLEMVQRRAVDADRRVVSGIEGAIEGARRAATLTYRLLAFSRQSPLAPEPIDPNRLVSGMSDLFRRTLGQGIDVETVLAGGLWWTHADVNQMESALLNLAVNARDAMPSGGRLTIETGNSYLDEAYCAGHEGLRPGQYVMIAVADTGTGMSQEVRANAFEPFFTTKPVGKGSGLGLAQVYGFARQSGGHVTIYSEVGRGTTVKLYFPRFNRGEGTPAVEVAPEVPTLLPTVFERAPRPGITVLCVEDDALVRTFSVTALEEGGYRVVQAASGPEALARLDAHPEVELLFTDVVLAGPMDGRAVADAAGARRPGLKVLFTTGYTPNAIVHHGRLDEGVNVLGKPFTAAQLNRRVRAALTEG